GGGFTDHSPGWAVGYWFLPIINLIRPYQIVRELWYRSGSGIALEAAPKSAPALVSAWWGTWVRANFAVRIAGRQQLAAETIPDLMSATMASAALDVGTLIAGVLAIQIVRRITSFSRNRGVVGNAV